MRLLVIDGNSIANRAFFGIKLLTTKDGRYTNAIYGFLNILLSLLKECEPDEVADLVLFLSRADYITGEVIRIDGGIAM